MDIGSRIKELRLAHDMSMQNLADKLYTSDSTICRWESGRMKISLEDAVRMADLFGVTLDELAGRKRR